MPSPGSTQKLRERKAKEAEVGLIIALSGSETLYDQLFRELSDPAKQRAILNAEESALSKALIGRLDDARRDFAEQNDRQVPTWGIFPAPWKRLSTRSTTQTVDSASSGPSGAPLNITSHPTAETDADTHEEGKVRT